MKSKISLQNYLSQLSFKNTKIKDLWHHKINTQNSFQNSGSKSLEKTESEYIPIEYFKNPHKNPHKKHYSCTFISSGTTSKDQSKSYFSEEGKLLYKAQSLKAFYDVLSVFFKDKVDQIKGYSLVPPQKTWPNSSLAKMVEWIHEFWDLSYIDETSIEKLNAFNTKEPVWIFATALHLIQLAESGFKTKLPKGSIIIETGGSKNQNRQLDRQEYYQLITKTFGIEQNYIVSEYGMCELACQAYDFALDAKQERQFRFPHWVRTYVTSGLNKFNVQGKGALIVEDPLRIDYPKAIRTQDIVDLKDQHFKLLSRVPKAPLKGCSLLVSDIKSSSVKAHKEIVMDPFCETDHKIEQIDKRITNIDKIISKFLNAPKTLELATSEFSSRKIAQDCLDDLKSSIPKSREQWLKAVENSKGSSKETCLIIASNNHSTVSFYPLCMALACGMKTFIRIPLKFINENSLISSLIKELQSYFKINILPASFRISSNMPKTKVKILFYGHNETISQVRSFWKQAICAFGSGISFCCINQPQTKYIKTVTKDALSLSQRGCLSARALLTINKGSKDLELFLEELRKQFINDFNEYFYVSQQVALDHEALRLKDLGANIFPRKSVNDPVFAIFDMDKCEMSETLSNHEFVLPILCYKDIGSVTEDLIRFKDLMTLSTCENTQQLLENHPMLLHKISKLGSLNICKWDGNYMNKGLFVEE